MVDGVITGQVTVSGGGGVGDAGDNSGHLFLDDAVVSSDRLLVVLKRDPQELVLELQRLGELGKFGRRTRCTVCGDNSHGGGG